MDSPSIAELKNELRKNLKARRLAAEYDPELAEGLNQHLAELCLLTSASRIACYLPAGNEPDTELFIDWALDNGIEVLLPVAKKDGSLDWVIFDGETAEGIFGFAEASGTPVEPTNVDLAIIPALAIDQTGQRLGKGKGFYDRALLTFQPRPKIVAVVFDEELLENVPVEAHDHPVDAVVTPSSMTAFIDLLK
jgi:5-formyltetrahydrofolate cyclo-ligase